MGILDPAAARVAKLPTLRAAAGALQQQPAAVTQSSARLAFATAAADIIPDAGHLPCIEQPDAVAGLIGTFLRNARYG